HYALSANATRLLVFGCIWAMPYEARMYDVTPWTMPDGIAARTQPDPPAPEPDAQFTSAFPLPLLFQQQEVFGSDLVLPMEVTQTPDGCLTSVALVDLAAVPEAESAHAVEVVADLSPTDLAIFTQLMQLPHTGSAIVIRRIDLKSGEVVGWSVAATAKTDERHVHILANHRVMVINQRIHLVDGTTGTIHDEGPV